MMEFVIDGKLCKPMIKSVFVYGTLKRGQCRENCWPARPIKVVPAWALGTLFSRYDYPAMLAGNDRVLGECWEFDVDDMDRVVDRLDEVEWANQPGQPDLYTRVTIDVFDSKGQRISSALTYHYATDPILDGFTRVTPQSTEGYVAWPETEAS